MLTNYFFTNILDWFVVQSSDIVNTLFKHTQLINLHKVHTKKFIKLLIFIKWSLFLKPYNFAPIFLQLTILFWCTDHLNFGSAHNEHIWIQPSATSRLSKQSFHILDPKNLQIIKYFNTKFSVNLQNFQLLFWIFLKKITFPLQFWRIFACKNLVVWCNFDVCEKFQVIFIVNIINLWDSIKSGLLNEQRTPNFHISHVFENNNSVKRLFQYGTFWWKCTNWTPFLKFSWNPEFLEKISSCRWQEFEKIFLVCYMLGLNGNRIFFSHFLLEFSQKQLWNRVISHFLRHTRKNLSKSRMFSRPNHKELGNTPKIFWHFLPKIVEIRHQKRYISTTMKPCSRCSACWVFFTFPSNSSFSASSFFVFSATRSFFVWSSCC